MSISGEAERDAIKTECLIPILCVSRLPASIGFYTDTLGFKVDWTSSGMASVSRDGHALMLCQGDQGQPGAWVWVGVSDIKPLFAEYKAKGVRIRLEPTNFRWAYEMRIEDPDGNVLRLGSEPLPGEPTA